MLRTVFTLTVLMCSGAWALSVRARRAFPCILAGVLTAGAVVTLVTIFGRETFRIFIKM